MELTEKEKEAIELTVSLWSVLNELPKDHPDDLHEFRTDIHNIQNRIFARPTIREFNKND